MPEEGDGSHFILHDICPRALNDTRFICPHQAPYYDHDAAQSGTMCLAKPILMCSAKSFVHSWLAIEGQGHIGK
jgi:hypothetical protein